MSSLVPMFVRSAVMSAALLVVAPAFAASAVVYGNANPNLAGRDAGYACCSGDAAPDQSPTLVSGLALTAGDALTFSVSGEVSYGGSAGGGNNPDGTNYSGVPWGYGDGISSPDNLNRIDTLVGVFLGASSPTGAATPASLDYAGGLNFASVSPEIGQIFFIGNGLTGDTSLGDFGGSPQTFIVPTGATRLYLGTTDGFGWGNNNGSFDVTVTAAAVPEPGAWALAGAGLAMLLPWVRRRRPHVSA
jgi:hypothetical protein